VDHWNGDFHSVGGNPDSAPVIDASVPAVGGDLHWQLNPHRKLFAVFVQGLGQLDDELGIFIAQVRVDSPVVNVNAGVGIAHYHVQDELDMLLACGLVDQHVVDKVTAHGA